MIDSSRLEHIKSLDIRNYLESNGCKFKMCGNTPMSNCIFHSDIKKPTLSIKNNKFKCFKCGAQGGIIDACMLLHSVDFLKAVEILEQGTSHTIPRVDTKKLVKEEKLKQYKQVHKYNLILRNRQALDHDTKNYFKNRNLLDIVELVNNSDNVPLKIFMNEFKGIKTILYVFYRHKFIIQKGILKDSTGKKYICNIGSSQPIPLILNKNDDRVVIVEGVEDALSILKLGYNAIVLNSVVNCNKLITALEKNISWSSKKEFILLLDNDEIGKKTLYSLQAQLTNKNFKNSISEYYQVLKDNNLKDINDYIKRCKNE